MLLVLYAESLIELLLVLGNCWRGELQWYLFLSYKHVFEMIDMNIILYITEFPLAKTPLQSLYQWSLIQPQQSLRFWRWNPRRLGMMNNQSLTQPSISTRISSFPSSFKRAPWLKMLLALWIQTTHLLHTALRRKQARGGRRSC